jgi:ATP-dependent helicase/DNAse subunit B
MADQTKILRLAANAVRNGIFSVKTVIIYGIFSPKKLEAELLDAVRDQVVRVSEFVPYANNAKIFLEKPADASKENSGTKQTRAAFAESLFNTLSLPLDLPIQKIGIFPDRIKEFSAIAEEICRLIETGVRPCDIAVLTPEVLRYAELAAELSPDFSAAGQPLRFTSSIGHPQFRSQPVVAMLSLLKTVVGNYTIEGMTTLFSYPNFLGEKLYISPRDLTWLSRSAGITGGEWQWLEYPLVFRAKLSAGLENSSTPVPEKADLAAKIEKIDAMHQKLESVFSLLAPFGSSRQTVSEFVLLLRRTLKTLGYRRRCRSPEDTVAVRNFFAVLASIDAAGTLMRPDRISLGQFYSMLFAFVKSPQSSSQHAYRDEDMVKILGFREIVHHKIAHVFLAGLTADVLPRVHPRLPFLTMAETLEAKTQTYEDALRDERYAFLSVLLAATESIHLSSPASDEGTIKIPSAWLQMFNLPVTEWEGEELRHSASCLAVRAGHLIAEGRLEEGLDCSRLLEVAGQRDACSVARVPRATTAHLHMRRAAMDSVVQRISIEILDRAGPPVTEYDAVFAFHPLREQFIGQYGEEACFSATNLETYAACPFRWYAELHLRLVPHPDPESDGRSELGNVIHTTMYRLITESPYFPPTPEVRDAAVADLLKIANEEFAKISLETPKWQSLRNRYIGTPEYPGRLAEVIDHEIELAASGSISPKELLEYSFTMANLPGLLLPNGSEIRLEGRIDRIRLVGGRFFVTDYKTGRIKKPAEIKSGKSLQLPLYLLAMEHLHPDWKLAGGTYYQISAGAVAEIHPLVVDGDCFVSDALAYAAQYRQGMQNGVCSPSYEKAICETCRERCICRFNKLRSLVRGNA